MSIFKIVKKKANNKKPIKTLHLSLKQIVAAFGLPWESFFYLGSAKMLLPPSQCFVRLQTNDKNSFYASLVITFKMTVW